MTTQHPHRRTWTRVAGVLVTAGTAAAAATAFAAPASASIQTQQFTCDGGQVITVAVADNHSSDMGGWGVGTIVDGGSGRLIPTSFSMGAYDVTQGQDLFAADGPQKGGGNANHMQSQVTCTQSTSGTLADLLAEQGPPPFPLPEWAKDSDTIVVTFTVTAVPVG